MKKIVKIFSAILFSCMLIFNINSVSASAYTEVSSNWHLTRGGQGSFDEPVNLKSGFFSSGKDHNAFRVDINCTEGSVRVAVRGTDGLDDSYTYSAGESATIRVRNCNPDNTYWVTFTRATSITNGEYSISSYRN